MSSTFTRGRIISTLALLAVLAAAAAAPAAPANKESADRSLSVSANAGYVASPAKSPTLTNHIGQPSGGAEWQLPVGIGLLALGLLGLGYGLAAVLSMRRQQRPAGALLTFGGR